jgi:hypothetical protein
MFRAWEELSEVEQLQCEYSDLHKEVNGFRPRSMTDEEWNSAEWLRSECQKLCDALPAVTAAEEAREKAAIDAFEGAVARAITTGARDREQAIAWLKQAAGGDTDPYIQHDPGYFEFLNGLPYGYLSTARAS